MSDERKKPSAPEDHFGAPDGVVVNVTKDKIWVREGILPDYPNNRSPQFDFDSGQLVIPEPPTSREEIQNKGIRDSEVPPEKYYPKGYQPELLTEWPVEGDLVVPIDAAPPELTKGMGENWRQRKAYEKVIAEREADSQG